MQLLSPHEYSEFERIKRALLNPMNPHVMAHCENVLRGIEYKELKYFLFLEWYKNKYMYDQYTEAIHEIIKVEPEAEYPNLTKNLHVLYEIVNEPLKFEDDGIYQYRMRKWWGEAARTDPDMKITPILHRLLY